MNLWRFDNANSLYYALLDSLKTELTRLIASGRDPVLLLPTGNTMLPFYRLVTENQENLSTHRWQCFNLDEYYPLNPSATGEPLPYSFESFMERNFYSKLKTPVKRKERLSGTAPDPARECASYEEKIKSLGGADLSILGLGTNGHIAFNEPGSDFNSRTRVVDLHPQTLMANFQGNAPVTQALTVGLGTLLDSKKIFIVALGKNKAQAVRASIKDPQTKTCPASVLQVHSDVTWFLDQEAASSV